MTSINMSSNNQNETSNYLLIPNHLPGYINLKTETTTIKHNRTAYVHYGNLITSDTDRICHGCGSICHINGQYPQKLRHIPIGFTVTDIAFDRYQYLYPSCGLTHMQNIPFKSGSHCITQPLYNYVSDLLAK